MTMPYSGQGWRHSALPFGSCTMFSTLTTILAVIANTTLLYKYEISQNKSTLWPNTHIYSVRQGLCTLTVLIAPLYVFDNVSSNTRYCQFNPERGQHVWQLRVRADNTGLNINYLLAHIQRGDTWTKIIDTKEIFVVPWLNRTRDVASCYDLYSTIQGSLTSCIVWHCFTWHC